MYFIKTEKNEFTNEKSVSTISVKTAIEEIHDLLNSVDFDFFENKNNCLFIRSEIEPDSDEFKNVSIKFEPVFENLPVLEADKE